MKLTRHDGEVGFTVRVQAGASTDEIAGEWQDALKVRLHARPVDGRANEALRRLLARRLNVTLAAVRITAGQHSRTKRIVIAGVTAEAVRALAATHSKGDLVVSKTGGAH